VPQGVILPPGMQFAFKKRVIIRAGLRVPAQRRNGSGRSIPEGGWEAGVVYVLISELGRLAWRRRGLWPAYPEDHIGRNAGVARREGRGGVRFTERDGRGGQ